MWKKLTALLLSLWVCLTLLPGQVRAAAEPDLPKPPAAVEPVEPESPIMPVPEEVPGEIGNDHNT